MINYGGGLIFPDSWAYGPPDPPEDCDGCGADDCPLCAEINDPKEKP